MARTSHSNVMALPDAAQQWNFDLFFPTVPGSTGVARSLTYKCKTTTLPKSGIEQVPIELHGVKKNEAGRATYDHTFSCTIMGTVNYEDYKALRGWRDYTRSWKNNTGADAAGYKVNLELDLYDNQGNIVNTIILAGCFLLEIGDIQFDGNSSAVVELPLQFSFDYLNDGVSF
jgi:hypothetical protein